MYRGWIGSVAVSMAIYLGVPTWSPAQDQDQISALAAKVKAVDRFGKGHREASAAVAQLSQLPPSTIPVVLQEMQGCSPLAANWFRAAVESSSQSDPDALPLNILRDFLSDTSNDPYARSLAFDLIIEQTPESREDLVGTFLVDPCLELRFMAVQQQMDQIQALVDEEKQEQATERYQALLEAARHPDQINSIAKQLETLGQPVDLNDHYGFLQNWSLIGPFDNRPKVGFDTVFPPEEEVNLTAEHVGKEEKMLPWKPFNTEADFGVVDLNEAIGKNMGAVAYAVTEFTVDEETPAEIRIGSPNGNKVWVNGELVISNHVYHAGNAIDQFSASVTLRPGVNQILLKICQNEQTDSWAQDWQFQARMTDSTGKKISSAQ
jgi:ribosomal protein L29/type II secretory pathway pseudopilin PulG